MGVMKKTGRVSLLVMKLISPLGGFEIGLQSRRLRRYRRRRRWHHRAVSCVHHSAASRAHDHRIEIQRVAPLGFGRSSNGFCASADQRGHQRDEEERKGLRLLDTMYALAMAMGMGSANRLFLIFIGQRNGRPGL